MPNNIFYFNMFMPPIPDDYDIPPTIYSILNSYVNFDNDDPVKITNLANAGRGVFFDFDYPLSNNVDKENFETMILNHFLMRRIGYDTVTAFKISLNVKLNEIMPKYNILFNSIHGWDLFHDGETITRTEATNTSSTSNSQLAGNNTINNISDRRYSNTPQNELANVRDGKYVTEYNYDQDNTTNATTTSTNATDSSTGQRVETIHKNRDDHVDEYIKFSNQVNNVYTLIFKDLEPLFYGLV